METNNTIYPKNIFNDGKEASGESFIGREELLSDLMNRWNESEGNGVVSLIGLNRMGKSSLAGRFCELVQESSPSAYCINLTLRMNTWPKLILEIMRKMLEIADEEERQMDTILYSICHECLCLFPNPNEDYIEREVMSRYEKLLRRMDKIEQKFLLIIDEFDDAKIYWKDNAPYFEALRDCASKNNGFVMIVSRRPLEVIEIESYGNSCFHNIFDELPVCAFNKQSDMPLYYKVLEKYYNVKLNDYEREKVEEYTGYCPTFLAGLGKKLASAAIQGKPVPSVEAIFSDSIFRINYQKHYVEFLKRMKNDGYWDDIVGILMGISSIRIEEDIDNTFEESKMNTMCCRGYLRKNSTGEYVVISDDFSEWAKHKLYRNEISTIYTHIINAEVAIREMLKTEMPKIWATKYPGRDWENDFLKNLNVPYSIQYFTKAKNSKDKPQLHNFLNSARKYEPCAGVADALTITVKLRLIEEFWSAGIYKRFNGESYSSWSECFKVIEKIRNPLFHATITTSTTSSKNYILLEEANANASRIICQLRDS